MYQVVYYVHVDPDDEDEKVTGKYDESDSRDDRDDNDFPDKIVGKP